MRRSRQRTYGNAWRPKPRRQWHLYPWSLLLNGLFLAHWGYTWGERSFAHRWPAFFAHRLPGSVAEAKTEIKIPEPPGERYSLSYQQWLEILRREAQVMAREQTPNLQVLLGDSLTLWFPSELLPNRNKWLNQGISGETSGGLLRRLDFLDRTQPQAIFVMIGINDLIRGEEDQTLLNNYSEIIAQLRRQHPQSRLVITSILPHRGEKATWERKDRLAAIPIDRIQELNQRLREMAIAAGGDFLDLYPLFANPQGMMRPELTSDGLHLSPQGYGVWSAAIQVWEQIHLNPSPSPQAAATP